MQTLLVTGGAGFIGSCFIRQELEKGNVRIINLDALTYAGNSESIPFAPGNLYQFVHGDIGDQSLVTKLLDDYQPLAIVNFAAESHVDRSIDGPKVFLQTNVVGTFNLLESSLRYFRSLLPEQQKSFRFLHISTDEVFGSLGERSNNDDRFKESTPYAPNSPYAASKASADMFVRAYFHTYGLPTLITNCSNNYGPYQFPEKMIPLMILNALENRPLPVYGDGLNVRDWLHVSDHCNAIRRVLDEGISGSTYNVGGNAPYSNLHVVETICKIVDSLTNRAVGTSAKLINFVADRPGHDRRYEVDFSKIKAELKWEPTVCFREGLKSTVEWYIANQKWVNHIQSGEYQRNRLGLQLQSRT